MSDFFIFSRKYRIFIIALLLLGLVIFFSGIFVFNNEKRIWANVLLNNFYFFSISLGAVVFIVVHIIGQAGWFTSIQRIPEAMGTFLPFAGILMLLMMIGAENIYEWSHGKHHDALIEHKSQYLNIPFFIIRLVIYFLVWIILSQSLRKLSLKFDIVNDARLVKRSRIIASIFIVFFAVTNSTSSWDWLMSIDVHWYSTLYGWYIFAGQFQSTVAMIILLTIFLKRAGVLPHANIEHFHDLGKYLFAFSIFWMYLWFSQYMLIWYGNIPEETSYYIYRLQNFNVLFFLNIVLNFFLPFFILLPRASTRSTVVLSIAAIIVLVGHWVDLYLAIMPGAVGKNAGFNLQEIGLTLSYFAVFLGVFFFSLSKARVAPVHHPFFEESLHYHNL